ncbi:MAG: SDR family oxidoreductase [Eudoraea sp.]|nr:SDR family oxidoreductase [Eudoraea sp.]
MRKKVVLITGGSSGIGKSIGVYLTARGYKVYGTTRNKKNYPDFNEFHLLELDVRDTDSIRETVAELWALEGRIDVLVNNAGVGITGPIEETPNSEILKAFDTNFMGPLNLIKSVLPHMRQQQDGLIINITSIAGKMGLPYRGIYSATKGALDMATEAMRLETQAFGVHMTTLAPGDFATNIASGRYHAPVLEKSPYGTAYQNTLELIDAHVKEAADPIEVAKNVLKIMEASSPRVHYTVGSFMQKFSIVLKKILPSKVYENLLRKHYKL